MRFKSMCSKNTTLLFAALCLAVSVTTVQAKDYVIEVNGIVCEFCSLGVAKKIRKLGFIDRSKLKKGVHVDVKKQLVTIAVKPSAELDLVALYSAIEAGGYNPVQTWELGAAGERLSLEP